MCEVQAGYLDPDEVSFEEEVVLVEFQLESLSS